MEPLASFAVHYPRFCHLIQATQFYKYTIVAVRPNCNLCSHTHTHAATQTSTGGVGTSDNRLNTNHLIGIIFGILGLVVAIIMPVSIPLARYYIRNRVNKKQKTNLVIPSKYKND